MPWGAVVAAGASAWSGSKSRKQEKALREQELAFQKEQLAFSKKRYDENQALYGETKRKLVDAANEGVTADLQGVTDRASADVAQSFQKDEEATARGLSRYGINPNSSRAMAARTGVGTMKAAAEAGLVNTSRRNEKRYAEDTTWNRRADVSRMGVAELTDNANAVSQAYSGLSGSAGAAAARAGASADSAYQTAGQFAGMGLSMYGNRTPSTPSTPSTPYTPASAGTASNPATYNLDFGGLNITN